MPVRPERAPLADAPAHDGTALLVVDMISTWSFPDADKLGPAAAAIAPVIGVLAGRCRDAGVPVVYANDNHEHWRSEFSALVRLSAKASETGAAIARSLAPDAGDYSVLKPKHSAFFATPLDLLLRHLRVRRVVMCGVSTEHCILMTAAEGRMRDYEMVVPEDGVAAITPARNTRALDYLRDVFGLDTTASGGVEL